MSTITAMLAAHFPHAPEWIAWASGRPINWREGLPASVLETNERIEELIFTDNVRPDDLSADETETFLRAVGGWSHP